MIKLAEAFRKFDKDGNKFHSPDEIYKTMNELGVQIIQDELEDLIKEIDQDND